MNYQGSFHHTLILSGNNHNRKILSKLKNGKATKFKKPLTLAKTPKLYIIKMENEIIYVGYTSQSISSRLNYGLKANGNKGYYGYKWKNAKDKFELFVFVFEKTLSGNKTLDKQVIEKIEAIEAELVFLIRENDGNWPKFQNEIHFHYNQSVRAKNIAKNIYRYITEN